MFKRSDTPPAIIPNEVITLAEVLAEMEETDRMGYPRPFNITYLSYHEQKDTGGEFLTIEGAIKPTVKGIQKVKAKRIEPILARQKRMVDHFANATRNIEEEGIGLLRTVHIWLIVIFNNKRVVWYTHG